MFADFSFERNWQRILYLSSILVKQFLQHLKLCKGCRPLFSFSISTACNFSGASIMAISVPWNINFVYMIKNICQVSQTMDTILSLKVFQEWVFVFFPKKWNFCPYFEETLQDLSFWKPGTSLWQRSTSCLPPISWQNVLQNAMIQRPASDKVNDFYGCW